MYSTVLSHPLEGAVHSPVPAAQVSATDCLSLNSSSILLTDATADTHRLCVDVLIRAPCDGPTWSHAMLPPDADRLILEANVLSQVCTSSLKIVMWCAQPAKALSTAM